MSEYDPETRTSRQEEILRETERKNRELGEGILDSGKDEKQTECQHENLKYRQEATKFYDVFLTNDREEITFQHDEDESNDEGVFYCDDCGEVFTPEETYDLLVKHDRIEDELKKEEG